MFLEKTMSNLDRAIREALSKEDAEFLARFDSVREQAWQRLSEQPDESLFVLVQLLYDAQLSYCASHALAAAALCRVIAPDAGLNEAQQHDVFNAALTMNLGMARLQDQLAQQKPPPDTHQLADIQQHPQLCLHFPAFGITPQPDLARPDQAARSQNVSCIGEQGSRNTKAPRRPRPLEPRSIRVRLPKAQTQCPAQSQPPHHSTAPNKTPHRENHRWGVVHGGDLAKRRVRCV